MTKTNTSGRRGPEIDRTAVRSLRLLAMLSQRELCEAAGLHQSMVSRIESGQRRWPHPRTTARLARALNVAPETLYKRKIDKAASARADELLARANAGLDDSWREDQ